MCFINYICYVRNHNYTYKYTKNYIFRKLAQKWHPDNFQDEDEKKKAEKKFMDIAAAKEVLTDPGNLITNSLNT